MRYSDIAIKTLAAKDCGIIKSNAHFWSSFSNKEKFEVEISKNEQFKYLIEKLKNDFNLLGDEYGIICVHDDEFPVINARVKNDGDKPYLLFYRGDITLLSDLNNNVAVIGLTDPDEDIIKREVDIVTKLVENDLVIVSGLALGCDTIAHKTCVELGGKTIAILPSQLNKISPAKNRNFATKIVSKGGLLLTEYYKDSISRYEAINRFIERDRLQALFSKVVVLIASYRKGEGDSGSRHAMDAARKYHIERYVMYNDEIDKMNKRFALNKDLINSSSFDQVKVLQTSSIAKIKLLENPYLLSKENTAIPDQLTLL